MGLIDSHSIGHKFALKRRLRTFKHWNWMRILVAAPLLLAVLLVAEPLMGQVQDNNTAPTAVDDTATTAVGAAIDINVVANDIDPDSGTTLSVTAVTIPRNGTAAIVSDSITTVTYTPNANFNGADSFDYTLSDGTDTDTGTVTVTVGPPAAPAGLTATVKSTQVTLAWDEPSDTSITEYEYLQAQTTKMTASDGAAGDLFGHSVAVDGDTAVVGAYEDDSGKGAAYVLAKDSSGAWSQVAKLTASDGEAGVGGAAGDHFGWSVAVDGDTLVVGAHFDDDKGGGSGSAYVFTEPSRGWADWDPSSDTETAKLTASDGAMGDSFGESVAVDGDAVVVGAYFDDDKGTDSGSAYVFIKPSGGWANWDTSTDTEKAGLTAKLTASDGGEFDEFGKSVAVDGDTVVVGAASHGGYGSAYVFTKPGGGWATATETAKLTPGNTGNLGDSLSGTFGASVAVGEETVVVGASAYSGGQGRAYVFTKPSGAWATTTEAAVLRTSDATKNQFGWSVAVDGDTVVVGAHRDDASDAVTGSGAAYLFTKAANSVWVDATETVKLTAADGAGDDQFGWSVAVGGGTVVVGAHQDDASATVTNSGSAYIYGVSGWTAIPDSAAGATSYTVNDLINDEEYGFWIRARNTVGASEASDPVIATPVNTAPMAVADTATMYEDTVVSIGVVANDPDPDPVDTLSVTAVTTTPSNGTAVVASGTTVTYTPNANFNGTDSFDYTLSDGTDTDTGTVNIAIIAVNDQPTALDYTPTTEEDTAVQIVVVHNDTDPDIGDTLTISPSTMPSNGEASATSTTTFTYKPKANFNGTDSFDYTLSDGTATATGTVNITVTTANDAPTAVDDTAATTAGTAVDINVVANDSDVEGDTLTVTSVTTPSNGTAKIKSGSTTTVTYTPGANFNGGSFDYTLSDGTDPDTGTVTVAAVTVRPTTPTGLTASAGLAQVTLNWTDPYDSSIDKYEYSQSDSELVWTEILNSAYGETNASSYTVTGLTNGITYSFKIRATNNEGTSDATAAVTATSGNAAPTFDDGSNTSRSVEENSLAGTNVGEPVTATDREGDTLTYSLSGSDSFSIDANGQITVASGANLDYETKSIYRVTVEVHDGKDVDGVDDISIIIDDTIEVTIALSDVAEVPSRPGGFTANPGNAQATLRWNNPSDSTITGHQYLSEQQVARLTAGDRAANDYFGYSVAVNGDTAVVGAYGDDSSKGAAYVLVRQSGAWSQVAKLTASEGQGNDQFGRSVAVDGGTVAVGAALADGRVVDSGAAYMFTKPDTGWANATETAKLTASDGVGVDLFGFSMAMDGDTVVVGAYWDDDKGDGSGSAYVFSKAAGSGWADATETVKLTAYLGAAGDNFGNSVALDENTMAVGAYQANHVDGNGNGNTVSDSGSAYVFTRQQGAWSQVAKLTAYDPAANDYFGRSVAVDGNTVVVGADQHDGKGDDSGAAYVFTKPSGIWDDTTETARLTASDAASDDKFGISVAVNGRKALVGARQDDDNGGNSGSAYVFAKPSGGWTTATETAKLTASDGAADDEFGISVAVAGDTVVVGAHQDGGSGSAYVYSVSGWTAIPGSAPGGTNATSYTVTNLTNDAEYDFRIRAVNAHGESDASDAATAVPMVSAEPTPTATAPMPTATAPAPTPTATAPAPTATAPMPTATATAPTPTAMAPMPTATATAPTPTATPDDEDPHTTTSNTAPTVVNDAKTTAAGTAVDIDVVANDSDLEGDTLRVTSVTAPSNGTAVIKSGSANTITYTPNAGFRGTDSFNYTLSDGFNTVIGTVTVTVVPSNRAPEAVHSIAAVNLTAGGAVALVDVAGRFTDRDADLLTYSAVSLDTAIATVEVMGSMVTFTPVAAGATTVEITASDPHGERATLSVPVTVGVAPEPTTPAEQTLKPTPEPTAVPTAVTTTAVPPTPTPTPVPPRATPTVAPAPTDTPAPVAAVPATLPAGSVTTAPPPAVDAEGGFSLWLIAAIVVAALVVGSLGIGAWRLLRT